MLKKLKEAIYSDEKVNLSRQNELDLMRTIVNFYIAIVHCVGFCISEAALANGLPFLFDSVLGGPLGAPMYLFAMGVSLSYTRNISVKKLVSKGVRIAVIGILLNIFRYLIPFIIGYLITGEYEVYIEPLKYLLPHNDILQFVPLALFIIALFIKLKLSDISMLVICLILSVAGNFLNGTDAGSPVGNIILGYFIGTEDAAGEVLSYFPVFNWLFIPVAAFIFGKRLTYMKNKASFYKTVSPVCGIIVSIYFAFGIINRHGMFGEGQNCYYHIITSDMLSAVCAAFALMGLYFYITEHMSRKAIACIYELSAGTNAIYCIHWVVMVICIYLIIYPLRHTFILSVSETMLLGAGITITSIYITHFWLVRVKPHIVRKK